MADTREKAVATAYEYQQGNIAGLDESTTRRLVASVVLNESRGGDLAITSNAGFVGRYQAGAAWLADAGYVDQDKLKTLMSDHRSEWSWAKSGGMTQFLEDGSNWKNGLSLDNYKQSAALQDGAFKINSDGTYHRAVTQGVLNEDDSPQRVAGFLKVDHMVGYGAAVAAVTGGRAIRDANGVSNYDYFHDITRNRDGLEKAMSNLPIQGTASQVDVIHGEKEMGAQKIGAISRNDELPSISYTSHPDHALYKDALIGIEKLPANTFRNIEERQNAAASLALDAKINGLNKIDHVVLSTNGANIIAVQGDMQDPAHKRAHLDVSQAIAQTVESSTAQIEQHRISQQQTPQQQQKQQEQEDQQKVQRETPRTLLG